uniref:Uncharacterized protein n=1 Tax=Maylandia zebra TaxID=106582 RepID=A0A3P9CZQ4_9CICH
MFFSFAVCPLKSQKSVLISALIWQNTASCTVSPLPFPSPGTAIFTHTKDWSFLGGVGSMNRFLLNYCLRLAKLLGHDYILKPKYDVVSCDTVDVWLSCSHVASALADPLLIEASCPLTMKGGISLGLNWVCAVLYILLNICTSASLGSSEALLLIKSIFKEKCGDTVQLNAHSFINSSYASSLLSDEPFPWISLMDAQIRETPLLRFLSSSKSVQQCLSAAYKSQMETPAK